MKLPTLLFISLALVAQTSSDALAAVTRLFSLSNIQQSVDMSYRFDANQGQLASASQHGLQEDYHFSIDYAVYKARLLHGQVALDLRADQNLFTAGGQPSRNSNGFGLLYDINGMFLDRFPYPVSFFFSSTITEVPREFASSYQQKNDTYGVGVTLASTYLPLAFSYNKTTNETSGLETDRLMTSDSFSFGASHSYKERSQSQLSITGTSLDTSTTSGGDHEHSGNVETTLNNTLTFGTKELNRLLYSRARVVNQTGVNQSRTAEVGESLNWDLGKALTSGADYSFNSREGFGQTQQTNTGRLWLQHRLFKSLTTRMDLNASNSALSEGSDRTVNGSLSLAYQKILPSDGLFQLQGHRQYGVTSNSLSDDKLPVFAEVHTVGALRKVPLANPNVVAGSIKVWNAARTRLFLQGDDYDVDTNGTLTEITVKVTGAPIAATDQLSIDYQILTNSSITYSSTSQGVGTDLALLNGKHRFFASWDTNRQDLVSGRADQVNLTGTDSYRAGYETKFESGSFASEYSRTDSSADKNQSLSGTLLYAGTLGDARYSLNATDRYLLTESNSLTTRNSSRSENVLTAGGSYTKTLDSSAVLTATANYLDNRGFISSDNLSLGLNVRWSIRRLTISVLTQANFRYSAGNLTSDEHLQLRLSRYF